MGLFTDIKRRKMKREHVSVYSALLETGYTDAEIREAGEVSLSSRQFGLAVADTPDGEPLVGVRYACDYRAEEEWGVGELYDALLPKADQWGLRDEYVMQPSRVGHVGSFFTQPSLILSKRPLDDGAGTGVSVFKWGYDITGKGSWDGVLARGSRDLPDGAGYSDTYDTYWANSLAWAQRIGDRYGDLSRKTMVELRELARKYVVKPLPRAKAEAVSAIRESPEYQATAEQPNVWPGWFHHGDVLVLRADRGVVADTLRLLRQAGENATLALGGGSQVFGSGLSLYDGLDVGPLLTAERRESTAWAREQYKALEPVKAELTARGHKWFFLGKPRPAFKDSPDDAVRYWLNGMGSGPGYNRQPFGWYSAEELLAEKFVADVNAKEKENRG